MGVLFKAGLNKAHCLIIFFVALISILSFFAYLMSNYSQSHASPDDNSETAVKPRSGSGIKPLSVTTCGWEISTSADFSTNPTSPGDYECDQSTYGLKIHNGEYWIKQTAANVNIATDGIVTVHLASNSTIQAKDGYAPLKVSSGQLTLDLGGFTHNWTAYKLSSTFGSPSVHVPVSSVINITGSGTLNALSGAKTTSISNYNVSAAGIGAAVNERHGKIEISGSVNIDAKSIGSDSGQQAAVTGAGIGDGGCYQSARCSTLSISDLSTDTNIIHIHTTGTVNARSGSTNSGSTGWTNSHVSGAGIGGGGSSPTNTTAENGSTSCGTAAIQIDSGTINAYGGDFGDYSTSTSKEGASGAGIGGGASGSGGNGGAARNSQQVKITINGGVIYAKSGSSKDASGAGVGNGGVVTYGYTHYRGYYDIKINGGSIIAIAGKNANYYPGVGIGQNGAQNPPATTPVLRINGGNIYTFGITFATGTGNIGENSGETNPDGTNASRFVSPSITPNNTIQNDAGATLKLQAFSGVNVPSGTTFAGRLVTQNDSLGFNYNLQGAVPISWSTGRAATYTDGTTLYAWLPDSKVNPQIRFSDGQRRAYWDDYGVGLVASGKITSDIRKTMVRTSCGFIYGENSAGNDSTGASCDNSTQTLKFYPTSGTLNISRDLTYSGNFFDGNDVLQTVGNHSLKRDDILALPNTTVNLPAVLPSSPAPKPADGAFELAPTQALSGIDLGTTKSTTTFNIPANRTINIASGSPTLAGIHVSNNTTLKIVSQQSSTLKVNTVPKTTSANQNSGAGIGGNAGERNGPIWIKGGTNLIAAQKAGGSGAQGAGIGIGGGATVSNPSNIYLHSINLWAFGLNNGLPNQTESILPRPLTWDGSATLLPVFAYKDTIAFSKTIEIAKRSYMPDDYKITTVNLNNLDNRAADILSAVIWLPASTNSQIDYIKVDSKMWTVKLPNDSTVTFNSDRSDPFEPDVEMNVLYYGDCGFEVVSSDAPYSCSSYILSLRGSGHFTVKDTGTLNTAGAGGHTLLVSNGVNAEVTTANNWKVYPETLDISGIELVGNAKLKLINNYTIDSQGSKPIYAGIHVPKGTTFETEGTGSINAYSTDLQNDETADCTAAAIGSNCSESAGSIKLVSGNIKAWSGETRANQTGASSVQLPSTGAAIGTGGFSKAQSADGSISFDSITSVSATISAFAGEVKSTNTSSGTPGAGIGFGGLCYGNYCNRNITPGNITIERGRVVAYGAGTVTPNTSLGNGAGIGFGGAKTGSLTVNGSPKITINGGTVIARPGRYYYYVNANYTGYGIGKGGVANTSGASYLGDFKIVINGGNVAAMGKNGRATYGSYYTITSTQPVNSADEPVYANIIQLAAAGVARKNLGANGIITTIRKDGTIYRYGGKDVQGLSYTACVNYDQNQMRKNYTGCDFSTNINDYIYAAFWLPSTSSSKTVNLYIADSETNPGDSYMAVSRIARRTANANTTYPNDLGDDGFNGCGTSNTYRRCPRMTLTMPSLSLTGGYMSIGANAGQNWQTTWANNNDYSNRYLAKNETTWLSFKPNNELKVGSLVVDGKEYKTGNAGGVYADVKKTLDACNRAIRQQTGGYNGSNYCDGKNIPEMQTLPITQMHSIYPVFRPIINDCGFTFGTDPEGLNMQGAVCLKRKTGNVADYRPIDTLEVNAGVKLYISEDRTYDDDHIDDDLGVIEQCNHNIKTTSGNTQIVAMNNICLKPNWLRGSTTTTQNVLNLTPSRDGIDIPSGSLTLTINRGMKVEAWGHPVPATGLNTFKRWCGVHVKSGTSFIVNGPGELDARSADMPDVNVALNQIGSAGGAAIGSYGSEAAGDITINSGIIYAQSGKADRTNTYANSAAGGAAIGSGGGYYNDTTAHANTNGNIIIKGGEVHAVANKGTTDTDVHLGAAIGSGGNMGNCRNGAAAGKTILISGGKVVADVPTVTGDLSQNGAAIGQGSCGLGSNFGTAYLPTQTKIEISGGSVTAHVGSAGGQGAAIGTGGGGVKTANHTSDTSRFIAPDIQISGGHVVAIVEPKAILKNGAPAQAIGCGGNGAGSNASTTNPTTVKECSGGGQIKIWGGSVYAFGYLQNATNSNDTPAIHSFTFAPVSQDGTTPVWPVYVQKSVVTPSHDIFILDAAPQYTALADDMLQLADDVKADSSTSPNADLSAILWLPGDSVGKEYENFESQNDLALWYTNVKDQILTYRSDMITNILTDIDCGFRVINGRYLDSWRCTLDHSLLFLKSGNWNTEDTGIRNGDHQIVVNNGLTVNIIQMNDFSIDPIITGPELNPVTVTGNSNLIWNVGDSTSHKVEITPTGTKAGINITNGSAVLLRGKGDVKIDEPKLDGYDTSASSSFLGFGAGIGGNANQGWGYFELQDDINLLIVKTGPAAAIGGGSCSGLVGITCASTTPGEVNIAGGSLSIKEGSVNYSGSDKATGAVIGGGAFMNTNVQTSGKIEISGGEVVAINHCSSNTESAAPAFGWGGAPAANAKASDVQNSGQINISGGTTIAMSLGDSSCSIPSTVPVAKAVDSKKVYINGGNFYTYSNLNGTLLQPSISTDPLYADGMRAYQRIVSLDGMFDTVTLKEWEGLDLFTSDMLINKGNYGTADMHSVFVDLAGDKTDWTLRPEAADKLGSIFFIFAPKGYNVGTFYANNWQGECTTDNNKDLGQWSGYNNVTDVISDQQAMLNFSNGWALKYYSNPMPSSAKMNTFPNPDLTVGCHEALSIAPAPDYSDLTPPNEHIDWWAPFNNRYYKNSNDSNYDSGYGEHVQALSFNQPIQGQNVVLRANLREYIKILSVTPELLDPSGGQTVYINAQAFNTEAGVSTPTVMIDSQYPCINVNVIDNFHLTCNSPAHLDGKVSVTVEQSGVVGFEPYATEYGENAYLSFGVDKQYTFLNPDVKTGEVDVDYWDLEVKTNLPHGYNISVSQEPPPGQPQYGDIDTNLHCTTSNKTFGTGGAELNQLVSPSGKPELKAPSGEVDLPFNAYGWNLDYFRTFNGSQISYVTGGPWQKPTKFYKMPNTIKDIFTADLPTKNSSGSQVADNGQKLRLSIGARINVLQPACQGKYTQNFTLTAVPKI